MERGLVFDRVAEEYDRTRPGYPPELIDTALAGAEIRRVLEVGCGTGQLTEALAARGLEVEAVEPGANLAGLARRRVPSLVVHAGRFEDVQLPPGGYDAVFSATAFHWIDPAVGWAKAARLLRPHGRLALLSHVYVTDTEAGAAQEALRDVYAAPWRLRDASEVCAGARTRLRDISEVWSWLEGSAPAPENRFGRARLEARPIRFDLDGPGLIDLQRTTATHLALAERRRDEIERRILELVDNLGGRFPIVQLVVLAVAERR